MTEATRKRKRAAKSYALDKQITDQCNSYLKSGKSISARSIAAALSIAPTSITRDEIRSKIIVDFKKQQDFLSETISRQSKRSRVKDAEEISRLKTKVEELERQNSALLYSHKALYNVIREVGGKEAWDRFFKTALNVKQDLKDMNAIDDME